METIPREIKQQNKQLGEALGVNPAGEPLYKWIWVNTWLHFMQDLSGYEPTATESGLIVMAPIYKSRLMFPDLDESNKQFKDRWHIGHWHDCGDEYAWRSMYGSAALWSRKGFYAPTDVWSPQGQLPTRTITDDLIARVRQFRATTLAQYNEFHDARQAREEKQESDRRLDIIGDAMTAYMNIPGSKSCGVSFPTPPSQIQPPAAAGD